MLRCGFRGIIVSMMALSFAASSAQAAPLGLSPGDTIGSIEWDALRTGGNPGDGAEYLVSTNIMAGQGRVNSVILSDSSVLTQSAVTMDFDLNFVSESNTLNGLTVQASATLRSPGVILPGADVLIFENGNLILFGNFTTDVLAEGVVSLNAPSAITARGIITVLGGEANLVAALGGAGVGQANLFLSAILDEFAPPIANLAADLQVFNSDFLVSLSGTLTPLNPVAFVPEPTSALLLGGGLVGLLGASRRLRRRQPH
jgi:hypothetical protein